MIVGYYLEGMMFNVLYVIILGMLQPDAEVEWFKTITQKDHHVLGALRDTFLLAICLVTKL